MSRYQSTKIIELGSCAFRQWRADHSHCHFVHGYRLVAKFWFDCSDLDGKNWVVDFGGLKELKQILEKQFDHTLCVAADDPLLNHFKALHNAGGCDLRIMDKGVGIERTAEWCYEAADSLIRKLTSNRCWVHQVEVWEHEKNSAIYNGISKAAPFWKETEVASNKVVAEQYELDFINPIANTVAAPAPEIQQAVNKTAKPANVGNNVSSGFGNLFSGTSWGS
jgi:6-pyruvoyltetrahydropterin/6-carboxytetrahydropterin synthase